MKVIAAFNNKGGVGKTTYLFHVAHLLADHGKVVLMVDCDSQCNLTAYALSEEEIINAWSEQGNSIYKALEKVAAGMGDIQELSPFQISSNLAIIPGDIDLSIFEDRLGDTWSSVNTQEISLRTQIAIYRYINFAAKRINADYVLIDLGPNLGALNRAVLCGCDYFITPLSPDLFSIKGTENLGNKFMQWSADWNSFLASWETKIDLELPKGKPKFLGYVLQQHNMRNTVTGMTKGWQLFGNDIDSAVIKNIVNKLKSVNQIADDRNEWNLGLIPNLHSLIPYSQYSHKPVYKCNQKDGLKGAHISKAKESVELFDKVIRIILSL